jgi:DNA-binding transcriptional ArsR family regulator
MMQTNHGRLAAEEARLAQEGTIKFQGQHTRQKGGATNDKIISDAYTTTLGNPVAKSILALLACQVNAKGYGWPSIRFIHERIEVSARTVQRHIQVFEEIGLLERKKRRQPHIQERLNSLPSVEDAIGALRIDPELMRISGWTRRQVRH